MNLTQQTILPESITHMVRNVECCLLFEVRNAVLEQVKVQLLPSRLQLRASPDQLPEQVARKISSVAPSNNSDRFLKTIRSDGQSLPFTQLYYEAACHHTLNQQQHFQQFPTVLCQETHTIHRQYRKTFQFMLFHYK